VDRRRPAKRLIHDAVAFRQAHERIELLVRSIGLQLERQPDILKPDGRLFRDAQRSAEIEVAFDTNVAGPDLDAERGRDGIHRHAGACGERLEQHVAGTGERARAARRGMQAGLHERLTCSHAARDPVADAAIGVQRHERGIRVDAVSLLDGRLQRAQFVGVHETPS
jgi:hypothetical protein